MPNLPSPAATLLMTTSLKGGTGKSLFACALLDHLRTQGHPTGAYDGDGAIGTLSAMHASREGGMMSAPQDPLTGVLAYNVREESRDTLIQSAEHHKGTNLHDLAGGALADLKRIFDDQGGLENLFAVFADLNIYPVFCHLITPDKATVESVAVHLDMIEGLGELGRIAGHIAILNQRGLLQKDDYPFWYGIKHKDGRETGGKTRSRLLAQGGAEMVLPHMNERTLALTKNLNIPFSEAIHTPKLDLVDRQRIRQFTTAFTNAITPEVGAILGVQNA